MEKQHLLEYENFSWLITKTRSRDVSLSLSLFASFPSNRDPRTKAWKALKSLSLSPSSGKRQRAWKRNERTEKEARVKVVFDSSWIETCLTWACDTQPNTQGRYAPFPCSNYNNIWPRKIKFFHFFFFLSSRNKNLFMKEEIVSFLVSWTDIRWKSKWYWWN